MSAKTWKVPGGVIPAAACLERVISAVFIHVQKPNRGGGAVGMDQCVIASGSYPLAALTHGSVCLRNTTSHSTQETSRSGTESSRPSDLVDLSSSEEQDGTLGRRLDPGPRDQTLVESEDTTSTPHGAEGLSECLLSVRCHLGLEHFEGLSERRDLEPGWAREEMTRCCERVSREGGPDFQNYCADSHVHAGANGDVAP